jgi:hypothetical protein
MTFYEAAVEVLREAGRPLHFKKITENAIRRNLLSHVGKTPETTMSARLQQEVSKSPEETLLTSVRPGVYALKEGVDVNDAKESIRLFAPVEPPPEEGAEPAVEGEATAEGEPSAEGAEAPAENGEGADAAGGRRRRRRRRRGRRNRADGTGSETTDGEGTDGDGDDEDGEDAEEVEPAAASAEPAAEPAEAAEAGEAAAPAPVTARAPRSERGPRPLRHAEAPRAEQAAAPAAAAEAAPRPADAPALDGVGDIACAIADVLLTRRDRTLPVKALAHELSRRHIGALGRVGQMVIRLAIEQANAARRADGRPPLFEETRANQWTLATASDTDLARSYRSLDHWQTNHRKALGRTLLERVRSLDTDDLGTVVTLLLDRMGYRDLAAHKPIVDEIATVAATAPRGLTTVRLAVRLLRADRQARREDVIAMRGSLHIYEAYEGAIIALGGVSDDAKREAVVANLAPVTLIGPDELISHLIENGVGVSSFAVDVSCIDEALFGDIRHATTQNGAG